MSNVFERVWEKKGGVIGKGEAEGAVMYNFDDVYQYKAKLLLLYYGVTCIMQLSLPLYIFYYSITGLLIDNMTSDK